MSAIPSYPKVWALGHKMIHDIFDGPVVIQEKVDGSQISFALLDGKLVIRSKSKDLVLDAPDNMFKLAVHQIEKRSDYLVPGWVYRGEYLSKPKHNTLAYDRAPVGNVILFDIEQGPGTGNYLGPVDLKHWAAEINLEAVPLLFSGNISNPDQIRGLLENLSILGGSKIEGVVVKNYEKFNEDGKLYAGKLVSEKFKEVHKGEWRKNNPTSKDVASKIVDVYGGPARWEKGVQHLRERGELVEDVKDIGALIKEVQADTREECEDEIKDILFKHFWPDIQRGIIRGLPEWYKNRLLESSFEEI